MYITTFYSFKGGVGRTMALANVAVELAKRGNRVLIVDFDLEAPGIPTFEAFRCDGKCPGLVEYVSEYIDSGIAPDVLNYVVKARPLDGVEGEIFLMPAGVGDAEYSNKLQNINWQSLYRVSDGYLMFEDMKEQWRQRINPAYVLIDSRTGHTDVGGICTRQLPDAVVVMFFPNQQNLVGLQKVISDIRSERSRTLRPDIRLHFAMSNVPVLDDELGILKKLSDNFKTALDIPEFSTVIHHYNSLSLLNQDLFTHTRSKSKLATEYNELADSIVKFNTEDRDGVIQLVRDALRISRSNLSTKSTVNMAEFERSIDHLRQTHAKDGDVLFELGVYKHSQGAREEALDLFSAAINNGFNSSEVFARRAGLSRALGNDKDALRDVEIILSLEHASFNDCVFAVRWLSEMRPEHISPLVNSRALHRLQGEELITLVSEMNYSPDAVVFGTSLLETLSLPTKGDLVFNQTVLRSKRHALLINYIHLGRFSDAINLFGPEPVSPAQLDRLPDSFNYACALWGSQGKPDPSYFSHALHLAREVSNNRVNSPNFHQCLALMHWVIGDSDSARSALDFSRRIINETNAMDFSAWRYLKVRPAVFHADIAEMSAMIDGASFLPHFMRSRPSTQPALPLQ